MPPTNSRAKTTTFHSDPNFWPNEPRCIFVQNFLKDFFLLPQWFSICFLDLYICHLKVHVLYCDIAFWTKFLTKQTKGIFRTKFTQGFIYFFPKYFSICFLDLYICHLQVFMQKWQHCIPKFLTRRTKGHFRTKFTRDLFFS